MSKKPLFARFLEANELGTVRGGDAGGQPNANASATAFDKNPNVEPIFTTLKAGKCGNDCDLPDGDTSTIG
jgi:hypothetical protein